MNEMRLKHVRTSKGCPCRTANLDSEHQGALGLHYLNSREDMLMHLGYYVDTILVYT